MCQQLKAPQGPNQEGSRTPRGGYHFRAKGAGVTPSASEKQKIPQCEKRESSPETLQREKRG